MYASKEFSFTGEHPILDKDSWTESTQNSLKNGPDEFSNVKFGHDFSVMFCFYRKTQLTPKGFLTPFFRVELAISIFSLVVSIAASIFGSTFFTIDKKYSHDREELALICGLCGFAFFGFKFLVTVVALRLIKREIYSSVMGCAFAVSLVGSFFSIIASVALIYWCLRQGIIDYLEASGSSKKELELYVGIFLISLSLPLFLYVVLVLSQLRFKKEADLALDSYMKAAMEEKIRLAKEKKRAEARKKRREKMQMRM